MALTVTILCRTSVHPRRIRRFRARRLHVRARTGTHSDRPRSCGMGLPGLGIVPAAAWADHVAARLADRLAERPGLVVCLPTGSTPLPVYERLPAATAQRDPTAGGATIVVLDEDLGLPLATGLAVTPYFNAPCWLQRPVLDRLAAAAADDRLRCARPRPRSACAVRRRTCRHRICAPTRACRSSWTTLPCRPVRRPSRQPARAKATSGAPAGSPASSHSAIDPRENSWSTTIDDAPITPATPPSDETAMRRSRVASGSDRR